MARRAEKVEQARRSLQCGACGAGNPLDAATREHGWFRCSSCDTPHPIPGVGDFAIQGPAGHVTRVVRPGSSEFETGDDFVLSLPRGVAYIALTDLAIAGTLHVLEGIEPALAAQLAPILLGVLAVGGVGVLLGTLTRQRLAVRDGRVDLWWVTLGRAWRHRWLETRRFHTSAYTGKGRRTGVEIRSPKGRLFLYMRGLSSLRWLEREIVDAIKDARTPAGGDQLPCPGCGGPVAEEKALRRQGGVECPHCQTGLVPTGGGFALPPARIDNQIQVPADAPRPRTWREGDTQVWSAAPWWHTYPWAAPLNVLIALGLDAAVIYACWWGVFAVPMFKVLAGGVALGITLACLVSSRDFFVNVLGRNTFRLGERSLELEVRIGPWCCRRQRVPLARLVSIEARRQVIEHEERTYQGSAVYLEATLAAKKIRMEPYGAHLLPVVAAVTDALPQRLRALGRALEN